MTIRQKITTLLACTGGMALVLTVLADDPFVFWSVMGRLALFSIGVSAIYGVLMIIGVTILAKLGLAPPEMENFWLDIKKGFKKFASLAQR